MIYFVEIMLCSIVLMWHIQLILKIYGVVMGIKIRLFKTRGIYCPAQWSPIFVLWVRYTRGGGLLLSALGAEQDGALHNGRRHRSLHSNTLCNGIVSEHFVVGFALSWISCIKRLPS